MQFRNSLSRRQMLKQVARIGGACAGGSALSSRLLPLLASPTAEVHPLSARPAHYAPKANRAIMFFLTGGASHVDSFDPKPELQAKDGMIFHKDQPLVASPWNARPRGKSGMMITDLFPHVGSVADDLCLIRSMHGDHNDHFEATLHMHTGSNGSAMPGIGAWVSYALGTQNTSLPSHIVFAENAPYAGAQVWDNHMLPAYHQGMRITPGDDPIPYLKPQDNNPEYLQNRELGLLESLNRRHYQTRQGDSELAARMLSFKTANSLQRIAPDLFDLSKESDQTLELYGVSRDDRQSFGWQTLVARRMAEAGVRFIELVDTGSHSNWDSHSKITRHEPLARKVDQPMAALLKDLKLRGMLDDTLVICCTEFGRTAYGKKEGRNHHKNAFSCWLAGGGARPGQVYGETDELGLEVAKDPVHVHDFHATILHLLGLDHEKLTYRHSGRDFRLTDVFGKVVPGLLA
jgi:hypothetical protein